MQIVRDSLLIFRRQMTLSLRNPAWVIVGLTQPILYLALFGPLLVKVAKTPGFPTGNAWQVFVPGLLVQLGFFGSLFVGFTIIAEWRYGVIERMRVTPVSRLGMLIGRVMRDVFVLLVQSIVLVVAGTIFGLRAPFVGVVIALGFVALLAISMSSVSYAVGLTLKSEDALAPLLNSVAVPLLLLSGILLPMSLGPLWLNDLSHANPFRYIVDAMRAAFLGRYDTSAMLAGVLVAAGVAVVAVTMGARTFQRENV